MITLEEAAIMLKEAPRALELRMGALRLPCSTWTQRGTKLPAHPGQRAPGHPVR